MQNPKMYLIGALMVAAAAALTWSVVLRSSPDARSTVHGALKAKDVRGQEAGQGPRFDVVFAVDATGSMSDEIDNIKREVWGIAEHMMKGTPRPDVRFGLVLYKDVGDDFLVQSVRLTRDVQEIQQRLMTVSVNGGGDNPEHVGRALHEALSMDWEEGQGVTRMIYLVGDAPGHTDYDDGYDIESALAQAKQRGIAVHTIGCSGIEDDEGRQQFTQIAQRTSGRADLLTYHAVVEDEDGTRRSVVTVGGETYEADEEIDEETWKRSRGADLIKKKRMRRARPAMKVRAERKGYMNNLGSSIGGSMEAQAIEAGVEF